MKSSASHVIVNAGCLLLFSGPSLNQDVLDSTLYVQLAASKKHSRFTEPLMWQQTWRNAALRFGWSSRASERFEQPLSSGPVTFWGLAQALCPDFVSASLLEHSEARLADCPLSQPAFDILCTQVLGSGATTLALQVGLVDSDDSLTLLQLHFHSRRVIGHSEVFGPWSAQNIRGNVTFGFQRLLWSEHSYAPLRQAFAKALRDHRPGLVCPVIPSGAGV